MLTQSCKVEGNFIQTPVNTSALEETTAQFNCTADGAASVTYLVNNMTITEVASIGVSVSLSAPVYNGTQTTLYLYVPVTRSMNNWPVVCIAYLPDHEDSPPAYIHVQAPPSAPQHLTANDTGATIVVLAWSQPKDTGLGGDLSYKVSYQDINGTSSNMTNTTTTSHNVTGLSPNTTYTMTVMADNGIAGNEENRTASVSVKTKTTDTHPTVTPHTINTHTSPEMVALVVVMCTVGVMAVVMLVLVLVLMIRVLKKHKTTRTGTTHNHNNTVVKNMIMIRLLQV